MTNVLAEAQGTTILDLVNQIFLKGEFVCPINYEVRENELVIGELSDYEKAIILASNQMVKRYNASIDQENAGGEYDPVQQYLDKSANEAFDQLLAASVHHRLGKVAVERNKIGFRKDWKIVASLEEDDEDDKDCFSCIMATICHGANQN